MQREKSEKKQKKALPSHTHRWPESGRVEARRIADSL